MKKSQSNVVAGLHCMQERKGQRVREHGPGAREQTPGRKWPRVRASERKGRTGLGPVSRAREKQKQTRPKRGGPHAGRRQAAKGGEQQAWAAR